MNKNIENLPTFPVNAIVIVSNERNVDRIISRTTYFLRIYVEYE